LKSEAQRIKGDRDGFFAYFRGRADQASRDDLREPEAMVLLTASLDALAKHWNDTCAQPRVKGHARRMHEFLVMHGGHSCFERVCAPLLRDRMKANRHPLLTGLEKRFPFDRYKALEMTEVATWEDDPTVETLENDGLDPDMVRPSSYGGVIYKRLRCAWVHALGLQDENGLRTPKSDEVSDEPYYSNTTTFSSKPERDLMSRAVLVLPRPFLLATLRRAIDGFEEQAVAANVRPFRRSE
jgi:hypothetical protein